MISTGVSKVFSSSTKCYLVMFIAFAVLMNEFCFIDAVFPPGLRFGKIKNKMGKRSRHEPAAGMDELHICLKSCVKCSKEDLDVNDEKDPMSSLSLTCANECLSSGETREVIRRLSANNLFDKEFTKCFIEHFINPDYE